MLEAGEDPLYVARGWCGSPPRTSATPIRRRSTVAVAAKDAVHFIGMPEGNTALAQAAIYLATAPKSNAVYRAYLDARLRQTRIAEPVPLHLRNAPTRLMKDLDYGKGYRYAHDDAAGIATWSACRPRKRDADSTNLWTVGSSRRFANGSGSGSGSNFTFWNISSRSGRMNEKRKSPCIRPIGNAHEPPSAFSTPPPDTPGWPSVKQVTSLFGVRWPT